MKKVNDFLIILISEHFSKFMKIIIRNKASEIVLLKEKVNKYCVIINKKNKIFVNKI